MLNATRPKRRTAGDEELNIAELLITISSKMLDIAIDIRLKARANADALPLAVSTLKTYLFCN